MLDCDLVIIDCNQLVNCIYTGNKSRKIGVLQAALVNHDHFLLAPDRYTTILGLVDGRLVSGHNVQQLLKHVKDDFADLESGMPCAPARVQS